MTASANTSRMTFRTVGGIACSHSAMTPNGVVMTHTGVCAVTPVPAFFQTDAARLSLATTSMSVVSLNTSFPLYLPVVLIAFPTAASAAVVETVTSAAPIRSFLAAVSLTRLLLVTSGMSFSLLVEVGDHVDNTVGSVASGTGGEAVGRCATTATATTGIAAIGAAASGSRCRGTATGSTATTLPGTGLGRDSRRGVTASGGAARRGHVGSGSRDGSGATGAGHVTRGEAATGG